MPVTRPEPGALSKKATKQMARSARPKSKTKRRTIEASATLAVTGKVSAAAEAVTTDLSPKFRPLRSRVLGCRHAPRDGVSRFGRAAFLPAIVIATVARSLGQAWPQATGEAGAQRA
jgi:hypothetical protein